MQERQKGGRLGGREIEVEILAHAKDVRVVEDVTLDVQVEGGGGEAGRDVVKLLGEQIIKEYRGVRAADPDHPPVGAIDHDRAALLAQRIAVMPCDTCGIDGGIGPLGGGGAGVVEEGGTISCGVRGHTRDGSA
ncbi:hypothetical protein GCM10027031_25800 [Corynebacterium atrinae]